MFNLIEALITSGWISMQVLLRSQERGWKWPPGTPRLLCLGDFPTEFAPFASQKDAAGFRRHRAAPAGTLWEPGVPPAPIPSVGAVRLQGARKAKEPTLAEPPS